MNRHVWDAGELELTSYLAELRLVIDCQDDGVRASWDWDCCAFARGVNDLGGKESDGKILPDNYVVGERFNDCLVSCAKAVTAAPRKSSIYLMRGLNLELMCLSKISSNHPSLNSWRRPLRILHVAEVSDTTIDTPISGPPLP